MLSISTRSALQRLASKALNSQIWKARRNSCRGGLFLAGSRISCSRKSPDKLDLWGCRPSSSCRCLRHGVHSIVVTAVGERQTSSMKSSFQWLLEKREFVSSTMPQPAFPTPRRLRAGLLLPAFVDGAVVRMAVHLGIAACLPDTPVEEFFWSTHYSVGSRSTSRQILAVKVNKPFHCIIMEFELWCTRGS